MNRVGIMGGTFDPIHLGHLIPAQYAWHHLGLARLLLVPSASPVHRPRHAPAPGEHRLRMCRLAAASLPGFSACDVEVARPQPSYTVLTLRYLAESLPPGTDLVLLIGEDNLSSLHTWHRVRDILTLATVAVLPRPVADPQDLTALGEALGRGAVDSLLAARVPSPLVPISATLVRDRVRAGRSIAGLVPQSVARYIEDTGLYRVPAPAR